MILIGTDNGIYRWVDGSAWPVFHGLQEHAVVGLSALGVSVAALDRDGTVLESEDNGLSWRALSRPRGVAGFSAVTLVGAPGTIVAAVKPLGLFRRPLGTPNPRPKLKPPVISSTSKVSFDSWKEAPGAMVRGLRKNVAPRVAYHSQSVAERAALLIAPKRVKPRADDATCDLGGWTPRNAPPAPRDHVAARSRGLVVSSTEIRDLIAVPDAPEMWYAAVSGAGLWKTTDAGGVWTRLPGLPDLVNNVRLVPGRPGHAWAATGDGAWLTTDGGQTWEERSKGLENTRHVSVVEAKPGAPDVLLAGCAPAQGLEGTAASKEGLNFALFESADCGKSWIKVKRNFPEVFEADTITDVRFDPTHPDSIIVALGSGELWSTQNGGFYWGPLARQMHSARVLCPVS